ncbi:MAG: DUF4914 family protein [Deltaproteobacteria bacterium]|nr:DUF4914 family protein [Deltaproteobacteria bacterium]
MREIKDLTFIKSLPEDIQSVLTSGKSVSLVDSVEELLKLALRDEQSGWHKVSYNVPGQGEVVEAEVCQVKNGIAVNYIEPYMRRRDPECMLIGDDLPTDQERYAVRYGKPFNALREETFAWLKEQDLLVFGFVAGTEPKAVPAIAICPSNAAFFALALAMLQGILPLDKVSKGFSPSAFVYVAPTFRHSHFSGKQIVVHNRQQDIHELFSYNLYPGPSAKKGVYGMLLHQGEAEGWITAHCSTVRVITPYDNDTIIMHEGASGGGKSEMLQYPHRQSDGRLLLGTNLSSGEQRFLTLPRGCELQPVADDMALCLKSQRGGEKKLRLLDAENSWFVRVDHINKYGTDPMLEGLTIDPPAPLLFLNIDAVPSSRALIWEHVEDKDGKLCPNPRVILPRSVVPNIVDGDVAVDVRSFGVRTPPCTKENPSYGILGMLHILPPALAWLWRLASPRGYDNPSIVGDKESLQSEGVGSFWPFATGVRVRYANLMLEQIMAASDTRYILIPNQHIGAWKVDFMPQWVCREYLARRGTSRFKPGQINPCRCPLLGYALDTLNIEGNIIGKWFLQVESQPEIGIEAYDKGAEILTSFFAEQLNLFANSDLSPLGMKIVECFRSNGNVKEYEALSK